MGPGRHQCYEITMTMSAYGDRPPQHRVACRSLTEVGSPMAIGRRNTVWPADRQLIKEDGHEVLWLYSGVDDFGRSSQLGAASGGCG